MRYAVDLSYLGTNFHGWQIQPNAKSVQQLIEEALELVWREKIEIVASGRTDTGVHASQQIIHFDTNLILNDTNFSKINRVLGHEIVLKHWAAVDSDFHARFDAEKRSYKYHIHQSKNPFLKGQSFYFKPELNVEKMNEACKHLIGKKDFESFSKVKTDVNTFVCDISMAHFERTETQLIFHVSANRFLRGMVRALVGSLMEVGLGNQAPEWIKFVVESKSRSAAGRNVPPEGLFLCEVQYDKEINWQKVH